VATFSTAVLNAQLDWFDDQVNAGTGTAGFFKLENASAAAICSFDLSSPTAFGAAAAQSMTAAAIAAGTCASAGTIGRATVYDTDATELVVLTVGTSSAECILTSLTPASGASISISSFVVTI
jgi:hypothetical protein